MTDEEFKKRMQPILDKTDEAMALMREARATRRRSVAAVERVDTSIATSFEGLRRVVDALEAANDANRSAHINVVEGDDDVDRAIDLMREANRMAITLLNELYVRLLNRRRTLHTQRAPFAPIAPRTPRTNCTSSTYRTYPNG